VLVAVIVVEIGGWELCQLFGRVRRRRAVTQARASPCRPSHR
jgi:hypothetical protein